MVSTLALKFSMYEFAGTVEHFYKFWVGVGGLKRLFS